MTFPILSLMVAAPTLAALVLLAVPASQRLLIRIVALLGATTSLVLSIVALVLHDSHDIAIQLTENIPLVPSLGISWRLGVDG